MFATDDQAKLCEAIKNSVLVELRYRDDIFDRTFAPMAVFRSSQDKVYVSGTQVISPADPRENNKPRNFVLADLRSVRLTDRPFTPMPLDRTHRQYRKGIICPV
jgi:hypothetical protein